MDISEDQGRFSFKVILGISLNLYTVAIVDLHKGIPRNDHPSVFPMLSRTR